MIARDSGAIVGGYDFLPLSLFKKLTACTVNHQQHRPRHLSRGQPCIDLIPDPPTEQTIFRAGGHPCTRPDYAISLVVLSAHLAFDLSVDMLGTMRAADKFSLLA
jgi:hypothetical protein